MVGEHIFQAAFRLLRWDACETALSAVAVITFAWVRVHEHPMPV